MKIGTIVALLVVMLLVGAGAGYLYGDAVGTATAKGHTSTSITTTTVTSRCLAAASLQGLPSPEIPFFTAGVNYSGRWNATVVAYADSDSMPVFGYCYTGSGAGYFEFPDWNPNGTATMRITACKMDAGTGTLDVFVNGNLSSTSAPFGSAAVSKTIYGS